jgi:hypothetical protein
MKLDWRITKTFKILFAERGKSEKIELSVLRLYFIRATGNQSKASFRDFLEKCFLFQILEKDMEEGEIIYLIKTKNIEAALNDKQ